jgi:hypothetical protein
MAARRPSGESARPSTGHSGWCSVVAARASRSSRTILAPYQPFAIGSSDTVATTVASPSQSDSHTQRSGGPTSAASPVSTSTRKRPPVRLPSPVHDRIRVVAGAHDRHRRGLVRVRAGVGGADQQPPTVGRPRDRLGAALEGCHLAWFAALRRHDVREEVAPLDPVGDERELGPIGRPRRRPVAALTFRQLYGFLARFQQIEIARRDRPAFGDVACREKARRVPSGEAAISAGVRTSTRSSEVGRRVAASVLGMVSMGSVLTPSRSRTGSGRAGTAGHAALREPN